MPRRYQRGTGRCNGDGDHSANQRGHLLCLRDCITQSQPLKGLTQRLLGNFQANGQTIKGCYSAPFCPEYNVLTVLVELVQGFQGLHSSCSSDLACCAHHRAQRCAGCCRLWQIRGSKKSQESYSSLPCSATSWTCASHFLSTVKLDPSL